ncbi:unnamed protein product [Coffea canephora]|uniref:Uncharacterized protein n=2 Tax=Coffea TaxID=13442 RepID=A0A068V099_COFCA|nr:uncharacterized protein LOC113725323 isoform X1 [Coffea arabica]XP_027104241.1 uncharacterized protein LOC113725323 isoform X1 [Coffea arabica]XP_027104242.1 uncharacterized protein LOC113725323 isoform X1 [Coffea arabica]CDP13949.1 unnamed protein product [Coffea canephora]
MGKSLPSPAALQELSRVISTNRLHRRQVPKSPRPTTLSSAQPPAAGLSGSRRLASKDQQLPQLRLENKGMEGKKSTSNDNSTSASEQGRRIPLAEAVADCVKRWFQDTLKEAKAGDTAMQVLVSQMYYSGYGIPRDAQKGKTWMNRASRARSSVWKVSDKHPGYNASDSDSEDTKDEAK